MGLPINMIERIRGIKSRIKTFLKKSGLFNQENDFIHGCPEGLSIDDLSKVVLRDLGKQPEAVCYRHLSGWKHSGAFRLLIKNSSSHYDSFVFKNAKYTGGHIAALSDLPVFPGPPEYQIYHVANKKLQVYLPQIYLSRKIAGGIHYQYIMEDLNKEYEIYQNPKQILLVCENLSQLHFDLTSSLDKEDKTALLQYDRSFSEQIIKYIFQNLSRWQEYQPNSRVEEVISLRNQLTTVYAATMDEIYRHEIIGPIHGDLNTSNILFHRANQQKFKIIDWEWAGIGVPHADLASLLKMASPKVEANGLLLYNKSNRQRSIEKDRQIYEWCKLQRGLFDAAFFAKQILDSKDPPKNLDGGNIERAVQRALRSYQELLAFNG